MTGPTHFHTSPLPADGLSQAAQFTDNPDAVSAVFAEISAAALEEVSQFLQSAHLPSADLRRGTSRVLSHVCQLIAISWPWEDYE